MTGALAATRSEFTWVRPRTLAEALAVLADDPRAMPFAGGTDLMVAIQFGALAPARLVDLSALDELRTIEYGAGATTLGALTTYSEIIEHPPLAARHPMLVAAARVSGAWAIRNRGTLGGNLANASPAADTPPALLASGARVEVRSVRGARWIDCASFHTGYRRTARARDELITRITIPVRRPGAVHFYRKVGTRKAQAISKVCVAATGSVVSGRLAGVSIALGSVAPTVVLASRAAAYLSGRDVTTVDLAAVRAALESDIAPIDDHRSTAEYRRRVAGNVLEQFVTELRGGSA